MAFHRAISRATRQNRVRRKVRGSDTTPRLSVYRSLHHIYAQVISDDSGKTLAAASTLTPKNVGKAIAQKCLAGGIKEVIFDRNGFLYHGRLKALADAAREAGLKF
jgi:large subunit ribosomal protein L18